MRGMALGDGRNGVAAFCFDSLSRAAVLSPCFPDRLRVQCVQSWNVATESLEQPEDQISSVSDRDSLLFANTTSSNSATARVLKSSIIDYENPIIVIDYDYEGL